MRASRQNGRVGALDAAALLAAPAVTRSVPYCFEMCQQAVGQSANTAIQLKRPFRLPIKPTRFRIHFANRVQLGGAFVTGTAGDLVGLRVALGKPTVNATTGEPTGAWGSPIEVMAATNVANGSIQSTPWINPATHGMNAGDMMLLGYSFTTSASSPQIAYNGGLSWQSNTLADLMSTTAVGTRANNSSFLQVIIEIEHTDAGASHLLIVGNSLSGPSAGGVYDNYGELGTYHQQWAMRTRNFASSIAVAGSYAAAFNAVNTKWQIFDNFNIAYVPDVVLYFASASSDVADSTSDATTNDIKTNVINMIKAGKSKYPTARQWLTDIPPRAAFSGANNSATTNEGQRHKLNQFLHMLPVQTEQCLNIDALFTDWGTGAGNPAARLRLVFTTDDTHGSRIFHDYAANAIPLGRKVS